MLPHELAALPVGTRIKLALDGFSGYDYGTVAQTGVTVRLDWDEHTEAPEATLVDTASSLWYDFIKDISLVEGENQ